MTKLIVFDLDDTLYPESSYVLSGYRHVAAHLASISERQQEEIYALMADRFHQFGRQGVFNWIIEQLEQPSSTVSNLVARYRLHEPEIMVSQPIFERLDRLRNHYKLALITNGYPGVQRRKVRALRLEPRFDAVLYSQSQGMAYRKPHPRFFRQVLKRFQTAPHEALMIGDDPIADGQGAASVGIPFHQVASEQQLIHLLDRLLASAQP
jgi:putative hydrolase of the HAD superfamily